MLTAILLALAILLLGVCLGACADTAARNAETRRQVRAIEWHAAQARHPSYSDSDPDGSLDEFGRAGGGLGWF